MNSLGEVAMILRILEFTARRRIQSEPKLSLFFQGSQLFYGQRISKMESDEVGHTRLSAMWKVAPIDFEIGVRVEKCSS
jgi:hypothetical protein